MGNLAILNHIFSTLRLYLQSLSPTMMPSLIPTGAMPWKMNMLLSWRITLEILFLASPRPMLLLASGFSNTNSMLMVLWTDTRLVGFFGVSLNVIALTMMKHLVQLSNRPLSEQFCSLSGLANSSTRRQECFSSWDSVRNSVLFLANGIHQLCPSSACLQSQQIPLWPEASPTRLPVCIISTLPRFH